ncbi:MAG TPA: hypothetical protein VFA55_03000, partial [Candidatus Kapabacteria bacterium]|nr:hypothetical protein [Candidatus Kapabacteria bacterium]
MKQRKYLFLCVVLLCACSAGYAQKADTTHAEDPRAVHIALLLRSDNDSVVLRWAPSRPGGWVVANNIGYVVERVAVASDGSFDPKAYKPLTSAPMKAWTLDEWKQRSDRNDTYAAISAQSLYGKSFTPKSMSNGDMSAMRNAADELSNRYGFALFAADIDPAAANGLGLRFSDHDVKAGERYVYRVYLAGSDTSLRFDTAYAFIRVAAYDSVAAPPGLTAEAMDKRITLRWDEPVTPLYT